MRRRQSATANAGSYGHRARSQRVISPHLVIGGDDEGARLPLAWFAWVRRLSQSSRELTPGEKVVEAVNIRKRLRPR